MPFPFQPPAPPEGKRRPNPQLLDLMVHITCAYSQLYNPRKLFNATRTCSRHTKSAKHSFWNCLSYATAATNSAGKTQGFVPANPPLRARPTTPALVLYEDPSLPSHHETLATARPCRHPRAPPFRAASPCPHYIVFSTFSPCLFPAFVDINRWIFLLQGFLQTSVLRPAELP